MTARDDGLFNEGVGALAWRGPERTRSLYRAAHIRDMTSQLRNKDTGRPGNTGRFDSRHHTEGASDLQPESSPATLADLRAAADVLGGLWHDDECPPGVFGIGAKVLGITCVYYHQDDIILGRTEYIGKRVYNYRGGGIKGGTLLLAGEHPASPAPA